MAVDPQVCEIMQREQRELVGAAFETLTHPDDCTRNVTAIASLRIGDGPLTLRKRYVRPDGSSVWANVQVSRLQGQDGGCLVGTIELIEPARVKRGPESLWRSATRVNALVQRRRAELGEDVFSDHGWLILLQIYLAEAEGRMATLASISDIAAIRLPLVTDWMKVFARKMLIEWVDPARSMPQLTARGLRKVESVLDGISDSPPPL